RNKCRLSYFSSYRRRHTISKRDWSSDVCSSDLLRTRMDLAAAKRAAGGLLGMWLSVLGATAGALLGSPLWGCIVLIAYLGSFAWVAVVLVRVAVRSARQPRRVPLPLFPVLSISAAVIWVALTVL